MSDTPSTGLNTTALSQKIADKIDKDETASLGISQHGNLAFANLSQIMEVAKVVAISQVAIPRHLRDNVGACLAVCIQASEWEMSPFAVANKSYVVNDRLAYEAQLVAAVILRRAPIIGRIKYKFTGDGQTRKCIVSCVLKDDPEPIEHESPEFGKIPVKNSPLWKNDPDQQLGYYTVRAMARRHFPDVLLGVYTPEEMAEETMREVTPPKPKVEVDAGPPKIRQEKEKPEQRPEPGPQPGPSSGTPSDDRKAGATDLPDPEKQRMEALTRVEGLRSEHGMTMGAFKAKVVESGIGDSKTMFSKMTLEQLQQVEARWGEFTGTVQKSEEPAAAEQSATAE